MPAGNEPYYWSIAEAAAQLQAGQISACELIDAVLKRIDAVESRTRAFECVLAEQAREQAIVWDNTHGKTARERGALGGIPLALKDIYDLEGVATTASSAVRADAIAGHDAETVRRLRNAGGIFLGKTVTDEFAYGTVCPPTRNPWDLDRVPGGSSGGSGAALAAGECLGALGSDTAGSIRTPAALNGICGLKPTFGRISKRGLVPLAWSVDHPGPMARTVEDLALLLGVIAGHDSSDPTTVCKPVSDYSAALDGEATSLTIGIAENFFFDDCETAVARAVEQATAVFRDAGARLMPVTIPHIELAFAVGRLIVRAEAASYHEAQISNPAAPYGTNTRLAIEAGRFVPATAYLKAQRARGLIKQGFRTAFEHCDVILTPTLPNTAALAAPFEDAVLGTAAFAPINAQVRVAYPATLAGLPALSVPCGFSDLELPIGLQLIGRPFDEVTVLRAGDAYQRRSDWHRARPPLD